MKKDRAFKGSWLRALRYRIAETIYNFILARVRLKIKKFEASWNLDNEKREVYINFDLFYNLLPIRIELSSEEAKILSKDLKELTEKYEAQNSSLYVESYA